MSQNSNFGSAYALNYDLLYREKEYEVECDFLEQIFARYSSQPIHTLLDLGCGTGGHAIPLAARGYRVHGVDRSEDMLALAHKKAVAESTAANRPIFHHSDIRTVDLGQSFDAVICMFAVMGYMTTNADLSAAMAVARRHLTPGGLFIFDSWHGPAVLTERPSDRYKIVQTGDERVIRFVHPELNAIAHTVDVHYKLIRLKGDQIIEEMNETHSMRFLFAQEIAHYLECAGFRLRLLCPFLAIDEELREQVWNLTVVAEAVAS